MKLWFTPAAVVALLGTADKAFGFSYPDCVNGPLASNKVCDVSASPADRAAALVGALNTTEKLSLLVHVSPGAPRIGLPAYVWWSEALHGVARSPGVHFEASGNFSYATSFPAPITLGASFDDDLVRAVADVIGTEARAFANTNHSGLDFWTPNINLFKDPRWGRGAETPGEDARHVDGYLAALLPGLEGPTRETRRRITATCKHFAGYDMERWHGVSRHGFNAVLSMQDLVEYYLPPFRQCARDAKVGSFMCSYNAVNGTPACANTYLINDILRGHWGWNASDNYITSDCGAVDDIGPGSDNHNFTQTRAEAAAAAYKAGVDTVCEDLQKRTEVAAAFQQGILPEATVDKALTRLYQGLVRVGFFDSPSTDPYRALGWSDVNTEAARALAVRAATEGLVLLKNDGTLPLKTLPGTVALVGFWANGTFEMQGEYSGPPPYFHNPVVAAQNLGLKYTYAVGPPAIANASSPDTWTKDVLAAAQAADVIVYCGGIDASVAREDLDRTTISWPAPQLTLMQKLGALGKPLIVAQMGNQVDDTPLLNDTHVSAILWTGYSSQSAGTALLDAIVGKSAPAGRLPVTQYPAAYVDQISMTDMALRPREGITPGRTYRWYKDAVLPFGFGLHYTNFTVAFGQLSPMTLSQGADVVPVVSHGMVLKRSQLDVTCGPSTADRCPLLKVPVTVTNKGAVASDFVVLLFVTGENGPAPHPIKTLVSYTRLHDVKPGTSVDTVLQLTRGDVARVDQKGNTVVYAGTYKLLLDVPTQAEIEFAIDTQGHDVVLDNFPQPKA